LFVLLVIVQVCETVTDWRH